MVELSDGNYCYYIPSSGYEQGKGWRPSIVIEGQPGHYPNGGGDVEPWYWGHDYETACKIAADRNAKMGLSEKDVDRIVASSMGTPKAEAV